MGERNKITKSAFFNGNFYAKLVINILKMLFQTDEQAYTKAKTLTQQYFLVNNIIWDHKFFPTFTSACAFPFALLCNWIALLCFSIWCFWCFVCLFFFFITFSISIFSKEMLTYLWWTWQWQVHGLKSKSKNIYISLRRKK